MRSDYRVMFLGLGALSRGGRVQVGEVLMIDDENKPTPTGIVVTSIKQTSTDTEGTHVVCYGGGVFPTIEAAIKARESGL